MKRDFVVLDVRRPEVASLMVAMLQAREAISRRSWSHPQEPIGEEWWADVLADPRARRRTGLRDFKGKPVFYRLRDETHEIILIACSKCIGRRPSSIMPSSLRTVLIVC